MNAKIVMLPQLAKPNIRRVLEEFLEDQRTMLAPRTLAKYESVLELLRSHLDGYAYQGLSKPDAALFERHHSAEGDAHREFCELFGPEKIVDNLGGFLGYFMIRKVIAGEELLRAAGTVTKKLSQWLAAKGYVPRAEADEAAERGATASRELPKAERAARILRDASDQLGIDAAALADKDYLEFDHFSIVRVESGRVWLEVWADGKMRSRGPIPVPEPATQWLRPGWAISCSLGRVRKCWYLFEVANVYPS